MARRGRTGRTARNWMPPGLLGSLLVVSVLGCSGGGSTSDAGPAADGPSPLTTCLMIRNCLYLCQRDAVCMQRCLDRAEAPARAVYDQVVACSEQTCPGGDIDCRCDNECFAGGACLPQVDECTQSLQEGFCTMCI